MVGGQSTSKAKQTAVSDADQVFISDELLAVMRSAVAYSLRLKEPAVTPRALLLGLLDDAVIGPAIAELIDREKLEGQPVPPTVRLGMTRLPEKGLLPGEAAALARYDTLAFKSPDGKHSLWLNREAHAVFMEAAQRAEGTFTPKHLAFGLAAEATQSPAVFATLRIEPGVLTDAIFKL